MLYSIKFWVVSDYGRQITVNNYSAFKVQVIMCFSSEKHNYIQ